MPSHVLQATAQTVPKFAIVGTYTRSEESRFVCHVAILRDDSDLAFEDQAEVWHCAPPIIAGPRTSAGVNRNTTRCAVHAVGFVDDLTPDEVAGIETALAEIDAQTPLGTAGTAALLDYHVNPPTLWVRDEQTGTKRYRKFSCVGFVCESYSEGAGILLLDLDAASFPRVDLETLENAYGDPISDARLRRRFGINGPGPWQIALAGYVLHALNRPAADVRSSPHIPNSVAEAQFPLQPGLTPTSCHEQPSVWRKLLSTAREWIRAAWK